MGLTVKSHTEVQFVLSMVRACWAHDCVVSGEGWIGSIWASTRREDDAVQRASAVSAVHVCHNALKER